MNYPRMAGVTALALLAAVLAFAATNAWGRQSPVAVEGWGFEISELREGAIAFSNRNYVFRNVPSHLQGWRFTRLAGGADGAGLTVGRDTDGMVFFVTAPTQDGFLADGWEALPTPGFNYNDPNGTGLTLFRREARAGERIPVPQGNWAGGIVVAPNLVGTAKPRERDDSLVPGVVITHLPRASRKYVGSPGIVGLSDGTYLAKNDEFGPGSSSNVTQLLRSRDRGLSWEPLATVENLFWASLFEHGGALYLLGTAKQFGDAVILRSKDGGETWTTPMDEATGVLHRGQYHTAPMPLVVHDGRIWRAMEDAEGHPNEWGRRFRSFMMSAPVGADLLRADSWTSSNRLAFQDGKVEGFGGWLEGNAVATPAGEMVNVLRADFRTAGEERVAIQQVSGDGRRSTFDRESGFVAFPGGTKKFTIRHEPGSGLYWTLSNYVPPRHYAHNPERTRNTVALMASSDLREWVVRAVVLYHPDVANHGFQYLDWVFEGDDLLVASRTAHADGLEGADNQHNANYLTFHRINNFRTLETEGVPEIPHPGPGPTWKRSR